ncbi:TPA: YicC family protein [Candidatus Poribacteria bacterium]|nr:YicC family protein [Candidatus Poribacteria bacterium]
MKSMTGYGRSAVETPFGKLVVEIKTLNHKYSQISSRIPPQISPLEPDVFKSLKRRIARGQIHLNVELIPDERAGFPKKVVMDADLAEQYKNHLSSLRESLGIEEPISLSLIGSMPGVFELIEPELDEGEIWNWLERGLGEALDALEEMRIAEGEKMRSDMEERLSLIAESVRRIKEIARNDVENHMRKLSKRMREILEGGYDESRLIMEAALLAERSDISEEILRMESHIEQFKKLMGSEEPVGRQMDFLLQEMLREATTMASKAISAEIISETVRMRSEIDKLREMAQNVE